jgi:type IV pilus assembly protein PilF
MQRSLGLALGLLLLVGCAAGGGGSRVGLDREPTRNERASEVFTRLGSDYMRKGQNEIALQHLDRAVKLNPRSPMAHSMLAVLYTRIDRDDRALVHHERAAALAPEDGNIQNNYASFLCAQRRYDEADAAFRLALGDPFYRTPQAAALNAGLCALEGGAAERAEEYFRNALRKDPNNTEVLLPLAKAMHLRGESLGARAFIQRHESALPDSAALLVLAIAVETALGNSAAASEYRQRLLTQFPATPEARAAESQDRPRNE